jgi:hypothetical protein
MLSKNKLIIIGALALCNLSLFAAQPAKEATRLFKMEEEERYFGGKCEKQNECDRVYAKELKAKQIDACKINAQQLCAECIKSKYISTEKLGVRCEACIRKLKSEEIWSDKLKVECDACIKKLAVDSLKVDCDACIKKLSVDSLNVNCDACIKKFNVENLCVSKMSALESCITGTVSHNEVCQNYKATLVFKANSSYNLGSIVNWNTILSDPNHNVSLTPYTYYTAPVSGEYIVGIELNQMGLTGPTVIVGTPVANIQILVNGVAFRQTYVPFLSFHAVTNATVDALIHLDAGDVVTTVYNLEIMTDTGFSLYPGNITILGNGTEQFAVWKIHYLSSDCANVPCVPCQPPCPAPYPSPCQSSCPAPYPSQWPSPYKPCDSWGDEFSWLH